MVPWISHFSSMYMIALLFPTYTSFIFHLYMPALADIIPTLAKGLIGSTHFPPPILNVAQGFKPPTTTYLHAL